MQFSFGYDVPDKAVLGAEETYGGFWPLIDFDEDLAKEWGVWSSFVAEYRSECSTLEEWLASSDSDQDSLDEDEMDEDYEFWGPSSPFDAQEAKSWAKRWIAILEMTSDEKAKAIFPVAQHLHTKDGRDCENSQLRQLIQQAECAERHQVKMTLSMVVD